MSAPEVVDLSDAKYLAQKREEAEARAENQREAKTVVEWDKRMQRVFKGIVSRPERWAKLHDIQRRMENGTYGPKITHDRKPRRRGGGPRP